MRWILVFTFFYIIPLVILFKNYKAFSRACIYACIYTTLATTIVIINMYISNIKQLDDSMVINYKQIYTSSLNSSIQDDLTKINQYKKQINDAESLASKPIENSGIYSKNIEQDLSETQNSKRNLDKAKYVCETIIEMYENMRIPTLSKSEYTIILQNCTKYMQQSYNLKYKAINEMQKISNNKNKAYFLSISKYVDQSNEMIKKYKKQIYELEKIIKNE